MVRRVAATAVTDPHHSHRTLSRRGPSGPRFVWGESSTGAERIKIACRFAIFVNEAARILDGTYMEHFYNNLIIQWLDVLAKWEQNEYK
ncbi:hypothetical protein [Brucella sp. IR073]|uniref:hypothetical protein n=1 Tax=unclassified Brucella TaxID=2632610 RepID=UPI003B98769C